MNRLLFSALLSFGYALFATGCELSPKDIADATYTASTATAAAEMGIDVTPIAKGSLVDIDIVSPITAQFDPDQQTTEYRLLTVFGGGYATWSGPQCGTYDMGVKDDIPYFRWSHPHPPCDETKSHDDVTVEARISFSPGDSGGERVAVCAYRGAASGVGQQCTWN